MKKYLFVLLAILVSGCGFEPLYVEKKHDNMWYYGGEFDTSIVSEMARVSVEPIANRFGQIMRNNLTDLLTPKGVPQSPKYRLYVNLDNKTTSNQALRSDITATRKLVNYQVSYFMTENGAEVLRGNSTAYVSYDILANPYSTTIAQKKGDEDAAKIIADDIALRIGAYFHRDILGQETENDI